MGLEEERAWEAGWGAGCMQMHTLGTQTALEGNGAGIQLTFPGMGQQNQDVNTALSPPEHRNSTGIPPAHHRGYTWPSFNSTQPHRAATEESD